MSRRIALLIALTLPGLALAEVVWKSDFETGDLTQWDKAQQMSEDRLAVISDNPRQGNFALRATVIQGDDPINASGNRNEVVKITNEAPGSEYWYSWSTQFPADFPSEPSWQLFTQWHQAGCCGSPPLEFYVTGEQINLRVGGSEGEVIWTTPLTRGQWSDFMMHVKWSDDPNVGFVELWYQGQQVLTKRMMATQFDKTGQYLKMGLYRDEKIASVGELFHDNFVMGTTMEDVLPKAEDPAAAEQVPATPEAPAAATPPLAATGDVASVPGEDPANLAMGAGGGSAGCSSSGGSSLSLAAALGGVAFLFASRRRRAVVRARRA